MANNEMTVALEAAEIETSEIVAVELDAREEAVVLCETIF